MFLKCKEGNLWISNSRSETPEEDVEAGTKCNRSWSIQHTHHVNSKQRSSAGSVQLGQGLHGKAWATWEKKVALVGHERNLPGHLGSHSDSSETLLRSAQQDKTSSNFIWYVLHSLLILARVGTKLIFMYTATESKQQSEQLLWVTKTASYFHFSY